MIGAAATATAAIAGFSAIFVQLGRQARNAIAQNRDNERTKLKLKIYEDIVATCAAAADAEIKCSGYIRSFLTSARLAQTFQSQRLPFSPPAQRFREFNEMSSDAHDKAIRIISTVERWTAIDPRIDIFRIAMGSALHDVREAEHGEFSNAAVRTMPIPHPQTGELLPWSPPSDQLMADLDRAANHLIDAWGQVGNVIFDFQVEMQNLLLDGLFEGKVRRREPMDPRYTVIRIDQHDELVKYFETETPWGRSKAETEAAVRAREGGASS